MKKITILITVLFLSGCGIFSKQKFPEPPLGNSRTCPELKLIPNTEKLSVVIDTVVDNYGHYHYCKALVDAWIKWYSEQKEIYNKK